MRAYGIAVHARVSADSAKVKSRHVSRDESVSGRGYTYYFLFLRRAIRAQEAGTHNKPTIFVGLVGRYGTPAQAEARHCAAANEMSTAR